MLGKCGGRVKILVANFEKVKILGGKNVEVKIDKLKVFNLLAIMIM